jgi:hypothetical protein
MAEYVGAVLGATSTLVLGRGGGKLKKVYKQFLFLKTKSLMKDLTMQASSDSRLGGYVCILYFPISRMGYVYLFTLLYPSMFSLWFMCNLISPQTG